MKAHYTRSILVTVILNTLMLSLWSQAPERSEIEDKYKWDLSEIYPSEDAWRADLKVIKVKIEGITSYKGKLTESAENLYSGLQVMVDLSSFISRIFAYPSFLSSLDQRNQESAAMQNEMMAEYARLSGEIAFIDPEILAAGPEIIKRYIKEEPRLEEFDFYLLDLFRQQEHVLSEEEERLMSLLSISNSNNYDLYNTFLHSDFQYPEATMSGGEEVILDRSTLTTYLRSENRDDRKLASDIFYKEMSKYQNTLGQILIHKINGENMVRQVREYETTLKMALDGDNIPVDIYHSLVNNTNAHMDTYHRYLNLKKRLLGVDTLFTYDLRAPVVKDVKLEYTYEEAQELILGALKPLGKEYMSTVSHAFDNRWIDVYPSAGKRNGAFSTGAVANELHPFILMNYQGSYRDVSTLIHELGHTMHTYYSSKNQSYMESNYTLFVAEVPSTINSILLIHSMLDKKLDDNTRLSLLMNHLDEFSNTVFRQVQFAEFELKVHEKIEQGEAITAGIMSEIYGEIQKKYYGEDKGIVNLEDESFSYWSNVLHFYGYNYYVYKYATSFVASVTLADKMLSGEKGAVEKFMELISAGGSDYSVSLLKKAGVDLTTSEPFEYAMKSMELIMDQVDEILD
jgi:oligoendopeptidase F